MCVYVLSSMYANFDFAGHTKTLPKYNSQKTMYCNGSDLLQWSLLIGLVSRNVDDSFLIFFKKRFIAQKISEIHRVTKLRNFSFNQFALIVPRRASDRECTVLGSYDYSSEKQVQRKNSAAVK